MAIRGRSFWWSSRDRSSSGTYSANGPATACREVATKRVLAKKEEAVPVLRQLFGKHQGQINAACRLNGVTYSVFIHALDQSGGRIVLSGELLAIGVA